MYPQYRNTIPRSAISQNTASALNTGVVPSESNLLQIPLVGLSGSVLCRTMGLRICRHGAQTVSSQYVQYQTPEILRVESRKYLQQHFLEQTLLYSQVLGVAVKS